MASMVTMTTQKWNKEKIKETCTFRIRESIIQEGIVWIDLMDGLFCAMLNDTELEWIEYIYKGKIYNMTFITVI